MVSYDNLVVQVINKVSSVVFTDLTSRHKKFAKKYVDCYDSKIAYEYAFDDVQQVRASNMLKDITVWELIFSEMMLKKDPTKKELEMIDAYNTVKEDFELSPFEIFKFYVEKQGETTMAGKLNIDCCQSFKTLVFCWPFFKIINREFFYKPLREVIKKESEMIDFLGRKDEKKWILSKAKAAGICFEEIFEK